MCFFSTKLNWAKQSLTPFYHFLKKVISGEGPLLFLNEQIEIDKFDFLF